MWNFKSRDCHFCIVSFYSIKNGLEKSCHSKDRIIHTILAVIRQYNTSDYNTSSRNLISINNCRGVNYHRGRLNHPHSWKSCVKLHVLMNNVKFITLSENKNVINFLLNNCMISYFVFRCTYIYIYFINKQLCIFLKEIQK